MGEHEAQPETEVERLQREAKEKLADLTATLNELDEARARTGARHATPEQRRRAFRVIEGGAAVAGAAAVWAWETARKPALAVATGTGALLVAAPTIDPGVAAAPPPAVVQYPTPAESPPTPTSDERREQPATPEPATATPEPQPQVTLPPRDPPKTPVAPTPSETPSPKPSPKPSASATAEVEVDLGELDAEAQLCLEVGLPPLADPEACINAAERLDLDVDLGLLETR